MLKLAKDEYEEYFDQYWKHASALRNWLVACGIGGAILFVTNAKVFANFPAQYKLDIVVLFMLGVSAQIVLAFINKIIHWGVYWGIGNKSLEKTMRYKVSAWVAQQFWIDIMVDIFAMVTFALAIVKLIIAVLKFPT